MLEDLLDAVDSKETSGSAYFLGSIVLIKSPNDPQSRVVDGQQRLTTLTILLSILRDLTTDQKVKLRRGSYVFEEADLDSGTQDRRRLLLRRQDRAFFQKHVQNPGATDNLPETEALLGNQQCIAENARYLRRTLESVDEARRNDLVAFVLQRCYVGVVAVPTADTARRIFTVLNARGLDLTPTDILKADLRERAGPSRESDLAERWEAVEINIGREKMVELFGHIRMIYERKLSVDHKESEPPPALQEPHDMMLVEPPCHPWEPIKIVEHWTSSIHCLICGEQFALSQSRSHLGGGLPSSGEVTCVRSSESSLARPVPWGAEGSR